MYTKIGDIGKAIEDTILSFGFKPVSSSSSLSAAWKADSPVSIFPATPCQRCSYILLLALFKRRKRILFSIFLNTYASTTRTVITVSTIHFVFFSGVSTRRSVSHFSRNNLDQSLNSPDSILERMVSINFIKYAMFNVLAIRTPKISFTLNK